MNDIKRFKKIIGDRIRDFITENVFYKNANKEAKYPYLIFSISDMAENAVLEIDIWDSWENYSHIEKLEKNIKTVLNDLCYSDSNIFFHLMLTSSIFVEDENKNVRHKRIQFKMIYKENLSDV